MDDIDSVIAIKIMGWVVHPRNTAHWMRATDDQVGYEPMGSTCYPFKFSPSQNIDDAWKVVEHITTPGVGKIIDDLPWSTRFAFLFEKSNLWAYDAKGAALEICNMALKAAGIELESNSGIDRTPKTNG